MQELDITSKNGSRKINLRTMLMAVAMTAVLMNSAFAAEPRSDVALDKDVVTVGDVFSGVTHDEGYVLAPAPANGKTMTLNSNDLQRISDAFSLGWVAGATPVQVSIHRAVREIGTSMIESALQDKISAQLKGRKFGLQLTERNLKIFVPESQRADISVSNLKYDIARGDFSAQVGVPASGDHEAVAQNVSGHIFPVTSVPVLKNAVNQGDLISADDIDYIDMREGDIGVNVVTDAKKLVGMSPRRGLAAYHPMTTSDVVPPMVVKKNDMVTMTLESGGMTLTTQGKALENGAVGAAVKIINLSSSQTVQAVVTGLRAVSVAAPVEAGL